MRSASFSSNFQTSFPCMQHKLFFGAASHLMMRLMEIGLGKSSLKLTDKAAEQK
jgi:hypothetical protein